MDSTIKRNGFANLVLAFKAQSTKSKDVLHVGRVLVNAGCDELTSGGFWILDIKKSIEYYSPKFRGSLGYDGEHDFPSIPKSWQNCLSKNTLDIVLKNYEEHLKTGGKYPYYQNILYTRKDGTPLFVNCSGLVILGNENDPRYMIGSHIIL